MTLCQINKKQKCDRRAFILSHVMAFLYHHHQEIAIVRPAPTTTVGINPTPSAARTSLNPGEAITNCVCATTCCACGIPPNNLLNNREDVHEFVAAAVDCMPLTRRFENLRCARYCTTGSMPKRPLKCQRVVQDKANKCSVCIDIPRRKFRACFRYRLRSGMIPFLLGEHATSIVCADYLQARCLNTLLLLRCRRASWYTFVTIVYE